MSLHSTDEGNMRRCADCHGDRLEIHKGTPTESVLAAAWVGEDSGWHDRLACQVCHIPAIARKISTKTEWYWADAGQDVDHQGMGYSA